MYTHVIFITERLFKKQIIEIRKKSYSLSSEPLSVSLYRLATIIGEGEKHRTYTSHKNTVGT